MIELRDEPDHERQGRQPGVRRREALDHLEPARQEDDRAEEREGGEEAPRPSWPSRCGSVHRPSGTIGSLARDSAKMNSSVPIDADQDEPADRSARSSH